MEKAILYTFRRCPYAMRARMALVVAGIDVEYREVDLKRKPDALLQLSPKGTVPVLWLPSLSLQIPRGGVMPLRTTSGWVFEQSLDIMQWALQHCLNEQEMEWIRSNDGQFCEALRRYKYHERYPELTQLDYRHQGEPFLLRLEQQLAVSPYLQGDAPGIVDWAIVPFVRQFAQVDVVWFSQSRYKRVREWLHNWLESPQFASIMIKLPVWNAVEPV